MKKVIFMLLALSLASAYGAEFDGMLSGADSVHDIAPQANGNCLHYQDITVITMQDSDTPGEQILVKNSPDASCEWQVESNWLVDSGVATYFKGKSGNWLIIDRGTSVDNRDVLVYDSVTHEQTFSDTYSEPIKISDNKLQYWRNIGDIATSDNCDKYDDAQKLGLSTQLQQYVSIDLSVPNLVVTKTKDRRCQMMQ